MRCPVPIQHGGAAAVPTEEDDLHRFVPRAGGCTATPSLKRRGQRPLLSGWTQPRPGLPRQSGSTGSKIPNGQLSRNRQPSANEGDEILAEVPVQRVHTPVTPRLAEELDELVVRGVSRRASRINENLEPKGSRINE